jgi:ATP-binding cassette subfamily F protein uup
VAEVKTNELSGSERRNLEKESARLERLIAKQQAELLELQLRLAQSDPTDYQKLLELSEDEKKLQKSIAENEESWLQTAQKLQG